MTKETSLVSYYRVSFEVGEFRFLDMAVVNISMADLITALKSSLHKWQ